MKFLLAPDSFKGSLSSLEACRIMREAILGVWPHAEIHLWPLADGGEGTLGVALTAIGGSVVPCTVNDPLGRPIEAAFGLSADRRIGIVEMALASGLTLLRSEGEPQKQARTGEAKGAGRPRDERDPWRASSEGTGQLLRAALDAGVDEILLGIGGSATNDGGAGLLQALGFELLDRSGQAIGPGARGLLDLHRIAREKVHPRLKEVRIRVACDVSNPLLGPRGASAVFAPQKGATPRDIPELERALTGFAGVVEEALGAVYRDQAGAGAAGGVGFALMSLLGAKLESGFDVLAALSGLTQRLAEERFDWVLSGEGRIDGQTEDGKFLTRLAALLRPLDTPLIAFTGSLETSEERLEQLGIAHSFPIVQGPTSLVQAMQDAPLLLAAAVRRALRLIAAARREPKSLRKVFE